MYLDLYAKNCFPAWNEVFTISAKVMTDLSVADPAFHDHLKFITKKNTKVNPRVLYDVFRRRRKFYNKT
jgi:hypothetical protein